MRNSDFKILFACSELTPWVKTGGLADVCGSLPKALKQADVDVSIALPGYHSVIENIPTPGFLAMLELPLGTVTLCRSELDGIEIILVNHQLFTNRPGNPYMSDADRPWPDNALRYALFSQAVCEIAKSPKYLTRQADIVHCHDWQTGLVPALLSLEPDPPATVFTIHNLAYQGNITISEYNRLNLPGELLIQDGIEFWGQASFIKGGIAYANRINTVSPTYAEEITEKEFGCGMEGLLLHRRQDLSGILNGIDTSIWNPATDHHLAKTYTSDTLQDKAKNKQDLQKILGLKSDPDAVVFGAITRLAVQKGIDIVLEAIDNLPDMNFQLAMLGAGDSTLQKQLQALAAADPTRFAIVFGYDEELSHKIEAGADAFLMPSRYEPCGLNQMYSHRYGTLPLVTRVGGLADTVIDPGKQIDSQIDSHIDSYNSETVRENCANGFVIDAADATQLTQGMRRVINTYSDKSMWLQMQHNAMQIDYSWSESATHYIDMYKNILQSS